MNKKKKKLKIGMRQNNQIVNLKMPVKIKEQVQVPEKI